MRKYKVEKRLGRPVILCYSDDLMSPQMTPIGSGFNMCYGKHREWYSEVDAVHIVEWLNAREAGYPNKYPYNESREP
jgi:hypothetical protein